MTGRAHGAAEQTPLPGDGEAAATGDVGVPGAGGDATPGVVDVAGSGGNATPADVEAPADAAVPAAGSARRERPAAVDDLRPADIVRRLDEYIVGQTAAKRAVAVALRNRLRRQRLDDDLRAEVMPRNILMIGPTGVGKTEIARRLARMTRSPFIKVEATKFTEVGYVGRDVESIIRDLLEQTITEIEDDRVAEVEERARALAEDRILDALVDQEAARRPSRAPAEAPATAGEGDSDAGRAAAPSPPPDGDHAAPGGASDPAAEAERRRRRLLRRRLAQRLERRELEERQVEVEVEEQYTPPADFGGTGFEEVGSSLADFFSQMAPPRRRVRRMTVAEARAVLTKDETDKLIDSDRLYDDAIAAVEESGIVFIDEVDKIAGGTGDGHGPDISGQGVQRDLLPLLEGSSVHTRYGTVRTDHILFIGAGAFTMARPSDLIPELQGRFPIRVELSALTVEDLERILVEPGNALTRQYSALLGTEGVTLEFAPDGVRELARRAHDVNERDENIGARRLFTLLEKVLEDLSFDADAHGGETVVVDAAYVRDRLADLVASEDLRRYIL